MAGGTDVRFRIGEYEWVSIFTAFLIRGKPLTLLAVCGYSSALNGYSPQIRLLEYLSFPIKTYTDNSFKKGKSNISIPIFILQIYGKKIKYQSFFFNFFAIFSNPLWPIPLRAIAIRVFGDKIITNLPAIYPILSNQVRIYTRYP